MVNNIMASEKPTLVQRAIGVLPVLIIAGLLLLIVGIGLLSSINTTATVSHEEDYWACTDNVMDDPCSSFVTDATNSKCDCYWSFQIPQDIIGDVTMYYELGFDQTKPEYANSRDNDQLTGNPGPVPSDACGEFRFTDDKKPIFPCGAVADSMFTDVIYGLRRIIKEGESEELPVTYTGILTEGTALPYRNPPDSVLKGFAKPKSWRNKYWEHDSNKTGVENEAFQAWMNTDLKRKPVWRLLPRENSTGVPKGNYTVQVDIRYFADRFNGSRKFIIEGVYPSTRVSYLVVGTIALILGIPVLLAAVALLVVSKRQEEATSLYDPATLPVTARDSRRPRTTDLEDMSEEAKLNKGTNGDHRHEDN